MGSYPSFLGSYDPGDLTKKSGLRSGLGDQYNRNQILQNQTNTSRSSEMGTLLPGYQSMATGGSPADNNALEQSVLTPLRGSFNAARTAGTNQVARTGNSAGFGSMLGELSREEGRQSSQAGFDIANEKFRRKMAGLQGLSQLYGVDTSFLNSLGNQQLGVLGIGNSVQSRSRGKIGTTGAILNLAGL
jgi:hypothetical protein